MNEKVMGYILLISGVLLIILPAVSVFLVFTKMMEPIKLFNYSGISFDPGSLVGGLGNLPGATAPKKTELISSAMLNDTSNLFAHVFLMGFLASIGQKLASLGVQLLRPIVIKLKAKDGSEIPTEK